MIVSPSTVAVLGSWVGLVLAVTGAVYAIVRWIAARLTREALDPVLARVDSLALRVDTLETTLGRLGQAVEDLPVIRATSERTELALRDVSQQLLTMTKEVSEIIGALKRSSGLRDRD